MTTTSTNRPRIVVGIDGSPHAEAALRWASRVAKAEDATIEVIAAWEYGIYGWVAVPMGYEPAEHTRRLADASIEAVFGEHAPRGLTLRVLEQNPARALLDAGKDALMIVVGCRGRGGFSGLLLGSVSQKVAEHATAPVLVVHHQADVADEATVTDGQPTP
jgi:nucleotide-binding universal stress UspA family protein